MGCHAQDGNDQFQVKKTHSFNLGDKTIRLNETTHNEDGKVVFIQLHDNERTAVETTLQTIELSGGSFFTIENNGQRNISFTWQGEKYRFDPNRIFTPAGREQTLRSLGNYSDGAEQLVKNFADFILDLVPPKAVVIAIHNNTNHRYSISHYRNERKQDAASIHINSKMDPDDFVFTTDSFIYRQMVEQDINVVLQHNENVKDDGSLSVYYGKKGRTYINIEAEHGHSQEQSRMISTIMKSVNDL